MRSSELELLAPAGGPEQFRAALAGGADAIFCGFGHHFNARRGATSFDDESFAVACQLAHLAGARVYVTVNVVIKDDELARACALVRRAWLLGADAFIIQDWGLLDELRRRWPQIELHVSTQANVHDSRGVAWCRDQWGVERVTLSRELSLLEIARIAQEGVELEGFGHGALCFCYSGICMMSSMGGGRSANRGMCAQPCRLPYRLVDEAGESVAGDNVRPLCPKDCCTIERLDQVRDAGISSLKVEGRLKGSDYVYAVMRAYRAALDELAGREAELDVPGRRRLLRRAFNRDFTSAYLDGRSDNDMMSYERSNNRGELVGSVVDTRDLGTTRVWRGGSNGGRERTRKMTLAEVDVLLDAPVGAGDLLEVRPEADPSQFLTAHAPADAAAGQTITCRTARPMPAGSPVRVIRSQRALDEAARVARSDVPRARQVHVQVICRVGQPFSVRLDCVDGGAAAAATGAVVEAARTRSVTEADLVEHVGRMGGSAFVATSFDVELDEGAAIRFSDVHKVRADACRMLRAELLGPYEHRELARLPKPARLARETQQALDELGPAWWPGQPVELCVLARDAEAARAARAAGATRIYATSDALAQGTWDDLHPVAWLDEVCREVDHERLDGFVRAGVPVAVGNVSELALAAERGANAEVRECIPVHNVSTLMALVRAGAQGLWLSPELTLSEIATLVRQASVPEGLIAYGRARAMTSEHCVLQVMGRCIHDCARCELRRRAYALEGDKGERYPVRTDLQGRSRIYAAEPLDAVPELSELVASGVRRVLVDGTLLSSDELVAAVRRVADALAHLGEGDVARLAGYGSGHLHRPIE